MDAKGDRISRYLEVTVKLKIRDYNALLEVLTELLKQDRDKKIIVLLDFAKNFLKVTPDGFKAGILGLLERDLVKRKIVEILKKEVFSKSLNINSVKIDKLDFQKKNNGILSLSIGISEYDYAEIFAFISKTVSEKIGKNLDQTILKILNSTIGVVEDVLPDDLKDEIITKVINSSSEEICELVEGLLKKELELDIALYNLHCSM